jgi:hypothetical protein
VLRRLGWRLERQSQHKVALCQANHFLESLLLSPSPFAFRSLLLLLLLLNLVLLLLFDLCLLLLPLFVAWPANVFSDFISESFPLQMLALKGKTFVLNATNDVTPR